MRRIAVYGKGGIGKSTISANLTAAISEKGFKVLQIGCDPKHDSTRLLLNGNTVTTVLDYLRDTIPEERRLEDVVHTGYKECLCVEAGGPEPGIGCAGRGIISAFEMLQDLNIDDSQIDLTLYDVLGDVVCGGFAVPLRDGYADTVYIVTSGEFMAIYAANNILKGTANYNPDRIGGIIFNSRGDDEEYERVCRFAEAVSIPIIASFKRSKEFLNAEQKGKTVVELNSESADTFRQLADTVLEGKTYTANHLSEEELEHVVLGRRKISAAKQIMNEKDVKKPEKIYTSRNVQRNEVLHGCAFAGAAATAMSISNLAVIMHSPRNCAYFAYRLAPSAVKRSYFCEGTAIQGFARPNATCTDMSESSMIFGGAGDLQAALRKHLSQGDKNIAVVTSCPAGIIGDDTENIVRQEASRYPDAHVVTLMEDGNINGDFMQGVIDASIKLTRSFTPKKEITDSVNLVGVKILSTTCIKDLTFIENIFTKMNIKVNCRYLGATDIEDLKNVSAARLSFLMNPDRFSMMLKEFLQDEYNLAFADNIIRPGMKNTAEWIRETGRVFNKEEKAEKIIASLKAEYENYAEFLKKDLEGKSIYVLSMNRDIGWILEMITSTGMKLQRAAILDRPDYTMDYGIKEEYPETELLDRYDLNEISADIRRKDPDILLSPYPMNVDVRMQRHIPLVAETGPFTALNLAHSWLNFMKSPAEGWRKDGRL